MADQLDDPDTALRDLAEVARRLSRGDQHRDVTTTALESVLLDRFESALTQVRTEHALKLARLASSLRTNDQRSAHVSTALAVAAGQVAAERTALLQDELDSIDEAIEAARWSEINQLHEEAGESHLAAAIAIQQSGEPQDRWAESMFQAGIHLDAAGRQQDAASIFRDYVKARDERDPVRIEAMFRLAQALEAELSWEEAADWYDRLIEAHPQSAQATGAYVPSARSLLALGRVDEARCRLQSVIDGETALRPGAIDYRDTLVMIGRMRAAAGEYPQAIGHLQEAADRWPDHPETVAVLFDVASARRSLGVEISRRLLEETLTPSVRHSMESDRLANLWEAAISFEQVIEMLEEQADRSASRERMHRASSIARSDCLSETGRIREAIVGYEAIARKWPAHPAAMHALVEIASAWTILDEPARAQAAHQRALARLRDLPDEVLNREDSFMNREVWERWMNTVPVGTDLFAGASSEP
jgi:TolA-binding protein